MSVEDYFQSLARRALVAREIADDPSVLSGQGGTPRCDVDELTPEHEGQKLFPILTIYTAELPRVPDFLNSQVYYSFHIHLDSYGQGVEDGSLVVRSYSSLPKAPEGRSGLRKLLGWILPEASAASEGPPRVGFSFQEVLDYPSDQALHEILADRTDLLAEFEANDEVLLEKYPCHSGVKIGGYPLLIQPTGFLMGLNPNFQIQVDGTSLYSYADSGIGYLCDELASMHWETM